MECYYNGLIFTECFLFPRHCSWHLTYHFILSSQQLFEVDISVYRWGNWGTKKLNTTCLNSHIEDIAGPDNLGCYVVSNKTFEICVLEKFNILDVTQITYNLT